MPTCAIAGCSSSNRYKRSDSTTSISFHCFPSEPQLRKIWITRCRRKNFSVVTNQRICSRHFSDESYLPDCRLKEQFGLSVKKRLKSDALPTLCLPSATTSITSPELNAVRKQRIDRYDRRASKSAVAEALPPQQRTKSTEQATSTDDLPGNRMDDSHKSELARLHAQITSQQKHIKHLECQLRKSKLAEKVNKSKIVRQTLKRYFTKGQVDCALNQKTKTHWKEDDIRSALTLRAISKKAYTYLRKTKSFPLPSISTLQRWVRTVACSPGILTQVISLLRLKGMDMSVGEKLIVLSCDEMCISSDVDYDRRNDKIMDPIKVFVCLWQED